MTSAERPGSAAEGDGGGTLAGPGAGWGVVGPGAIAEVFASSLRRHGTGHVAAVFGRDRARREAFAGRHHARAVDELAALVAAPGVQAVYVATPHSAHAAAVEAALHAGRAVLCEKPLTPEPATSERLHALAARRGGPLVEGWMYRHHPQWAALLAHLRAGTVGRPRQLRSAFGFVAPDDPGGRLLDPALAGGGLLDVGGYPVSVALGVAGAVHGERFVEPVAWDAVEVRHGPTGVDVYATAALRFDGGLEAELAVSLERDLGMVVEVEGEGGRLWLEQPFLPEGLRDGLLGRLHVEVAGQPPRVEEHVADVDSFAAEARLVARLMVDGLPQPPAPLVDAAESLAIARVVDGWRAGGPR